MHIQSIEISSTLPLRGDPLVQGIGGQPITLDPKVNLLVGPNASGKSVILQLAASLPEARRFPENDNRTGPYETSNEDLLIQCRFTLSPDWPPSGQGLRTPDVMPVLHLPASRTSAPPGAGWDEIPVMPGTSHVRLLSKLPVQSLLESAVDTSSGEFRGEYIEMARRKLWETVPENREEMDQEAFEEFFNFQYAMTIGARCARDICQDLIALPGDLGEKDVAEEDINEGAHIMAGRIATRGRLAPMPWEDQDQEEWRFMVRHFGELSAGTGSVMAWTTALAFKMGIHHGWASNWPDLPAILLLDELENQLHPAWQMRVIPALMHNFPNLQIIASTHSPFVALNLERGQIHKLSRTTEGDISITRWNQDTFGWTADRAARELFEVQTPSGQAAAAAAQELRKLQEQGPEPETEHEEIRQERMARLRNRINEELLGSTGPELRPGSPERN